MLNDNAGINHKTKNGDAAFLSPGTKLYEMKGYNPDFRIIANGKVYEVNEPGNAKKLGDFLDIDGKVESVWFLSNYDNSPLHPMSIEVSEEFIDEFLNLDYEPYHNIHTNITGDQTFIEFRLKDGTSTITVFWIEGNVFSIGAFGSSRIQEIIETELLDQ